MRFERIAVVIALLVGASIHARAQTIRAVVTEEGTARQLPGVLISIASSSGHIAHGDTAWVLTNQRGEFAVRVLPSDRPVFPNVDRPGPVDGETDSPEPVLNWSVPPGTIEARSVRTRRER